MTKPFRFLSVDESYAKMDDAELEKVRRKTVHPPALVANLMW